jgi:hypothetical protein
MKNDSWSDGFSERRNSINGSEEKLVVAGMEPAKNSKALPTQCPQP